MKVAFGANGPSLDDFLDSYEEGQLPGIWGLLKGIADVLTSHHPHPGSWRIQWLGWGLRSALDIVVLVRSYRRRKDPEFGKVRDSPLRTRIQELGLVLVPSLSVLSSLVYGYLDGLDVDIELVGTQPPRDRLEAIQQKMDGQSVIKRFDLGGVQVVYAFVSYDPVKDDAGSRAFAGVGPYVKPDDLHRVIALVADRIWGKAGGGLMVTTHVANRQRATLVEPCPPPDAYVPAPSGRHDIRRTAARIELYRQRGVTRAYLLVGPPGTGKTAWARNLAAHIGGGRTLRIEPEVVERWGAQAVGNLAQALVPDVIIMDDIDRHDGGAQFLHFLERDKGVPEWARRIVLVATANTTDELDPALLRAGRFDEVIQIDEPHADHRRLLVAEYARQFGEDLLPDVAEAVITATDGFSVADIRDLVSVCVCVGWSHLDEEVARISDQRELYAGGAVEEFLRRRQRPAGPPTPVMEDDG